MSWEMYWPVRAAAVSTESKKKEVHQAIQTEAGTCNTGGFKQTALEIKGLCPLRWGRRKNSLIPDGKFNFFTLLSHTQTWNTNTCINRTIHALRFRALLHLYLVCTGTWAHDPLVPKPNPHELSCWHSCLHSARQNFGYPQLGGRYTIECLHIENICVWSSITDFFSKYRIVFLTHYFFVQKYSVPRTTVGTSVEQISHLLYSMTVQQQLGLSASDYTDFSVHVLYANGFTLSDAVSSPLFSLQWVDVWGSQMTMKGGKVRSRLVDRRKRQWMVSRKL